MKRTYVLIFILCGILLGYSYSSLTIDTPLDNFKAERIDVDIRGEKLTRAFSGLKKDQYLLKLKSPIHKQYSPSAITLNNQPLDLQESKRGSLKKIILCEIPMHLVNDDENILEISYPTVVSSDIAITLSNYRKSLSGEKFFLLFKPSRVLLRSGIAQGLENSFILILLAMLALAIITTLTYLLIRSLRLSMNNFFKIEVLSLTPAIAIVVLLNLVSILSPYQIIVDRVYFLEIVFIPVFLLKVFLIYSNQQKESTFSFGFALSSLKDKLLYFELSDRFIILFIAFLLLCALSFILKMRQLAGFLATLAYVFIIIGTLMKLIQVYRTRG